MDVACNCTVYVEPPTPDASTRGRFGRDLEPLVKVQPSWDVYDPYEVSRSDDCGLGWLALAAVVAMIATAIAVAIAGALLADWVLN